MRIPGLLVLMAAVAVAAAAQRAENNSDEELQARNAPGLFVASASAFGPDKRGRTTFSIEVNNTDKKTVTAVEWEYYKSATVTRLDAEPLFKFRSDAKIAPGDKKRLTEQVDKYSQKLVAGFRLGAVRVTRVDYEDGSSWQRHKLGR